MVAVVTALVVCAVAAATPQEMYDAARVRERAVRAAFDEADDEQQTLMEGRAVVTAYREVVRAFPASEYADDSLWFAGRLSLDLFDRFGQTRDRTAGVKLLERLAAEYPRARLAKRVPDVLADHGATTASAPPRAAVNSPTTAAMATVKSVNRVVIPDGARVTIELDAEVAFHDERIEAPDRIFVDLTPTRLAPGLADRTFRFDGGGLVRQVRVGRHPGSRTRVVLEAAGVATYSVYPLYNPYRLVIECNRPASAETSTPVLAMHRLPRGQVRVPTVVPLSGTALASAHAAATVGTATEPIRDLPPAPPPPKPHSGFSIARQLGLGVSRIVIDPGHGGHDPGAKGNGITEAELVLDVAQRLEKQLQRLTGVEVVLTRSTDEFVTLQERTAIANRENADLFLSIHANASENPQARGVETYYLNFANNLSAAAVAARENAASGQAMGALPDFVKAIALNNKLDESRDFATMVQRSMIERLRTTNKTVRDLGVKQAPFVVLIGAAMPSVLAEISFITNTQDVRLLKSPAYRQHIADALLVAIKGYQASLEDLAPAARR